MNSILNDFFNEERKRVFEPGPYFTQRVLARLSERVPGVWEVIPRATRPVLGLALALLFAVLAVQILMPVEPARGPIEAYATQDLSPMDRLLFIDADVPEAGVYLEEWTLLEPAP
jgi:CBS-domain-containing membrane protein